jgi:hypothetical protein
VPLGLKKAANLLIRSVIENTLKHVYYKDHPIEFKLLNEDNETKISDKELLNYLRNHPLYRKRRNISEVLGFINNVYHEKSKVVHGTSLKYVISIKTISEIKNRKKLEDMVNDFVKIISYIMTIIIIFHIKQFYKFSPEEKKLILSCIQSKHKQIIHNY